MLYINLSAEQHCAYASTSVLCPDSQLLRLARVNSKLILLNAGTYTEFELSGRVTKSAPTCSSYIRGGLESESDHP